MDSADSFMNWGFNPKGQGDSEDIVFNYSTMFAYEAWWEASLNMPRIYWSLDDALTEISNIILRHFEDHFDGQGINMDDEQFWFLMTYSFRQIPDFSVENVYGYYLPQAVYPQYWDGEGDFNPWDLGIIADAEADFYEAFMEKLKSELQLWKEGVLEYIKDHPLQINESKQYLNWIFWYYSEDDDHNYQGKVWMVQHP
jgi:hypothetical protein